MKSETPTVSHGVGVGVGSSGSTLTVPCQRSQLIPSLAQRLNCMTQSHVRAGVLLDSHVG